MKPSGWVALALALALPAPGRADILVGTGPAPGGAAVTAAGFHHRSHHFSFNLTRVTVFPSFAGGLFPGPPAYSPAYAGFVPWGGWFNPWAGYPFVNTAGLYGTLGAPTVIVPALPIEGIDLAPVPQLPPVIVPPMPPERPLPGNVAGRFRPVEPIDRERARQPVRPELPPPAPQNPLAEQASLTKEGRQAFARGEYGRAAELFRRAIAVAPKLADAYFLLAQAQLAAGKYHDAVANIHRGLDLQPDWPAEGPPLRDLYAGRPAELAEHLRDLEESAADRPDDPALTFLRAYVRWFDGRRDEARALFRQVRDRVARPDVIDRFLGAAPGA